MTVILNDFRLVNNWEPDRKGPSWLNFDSEAPDVPAYLTDQSTGRRYWNESLPVVSFKCLLLAVGTPIVHTIAAVISAVCRIFIILSLSEDAGEHALKLLATPFAVVGLELAAIYGIFNPYDGRKLYASIERALYSQHLLAPCFQPDPKSHLFGGNINQRNAF